MCRLLAAATVAFAALTAPVSAATVEVVPDPESPEYGVVVEYAAAPGERNVVRVSRAGTRDVRVSDSGAVIDAGEGCRQVDDHTAECSARDLFSAVVRTGDGADEVASGDGVSLRADGGAGRDRLLGGAQSDILDGGDTPGRVVADVIDGGAGNDTMSYRGRRRAVRVDLSDDAPDGQRGERDRLGSIESLIGGRGDDLLVAPPGTLPYSKLEGLGGNDVIRADDGDGWVEAGDGNDRVDAGDGSDYAFGGDGHDRIRGGAGRDVLYGMDGRDRVRCGGDVDNVDPSRRDRLSDCERGFEFGDYVGAGSMHFDLVPQRLDRSRVVFSIDCIEPPDDELDFPPPVRGTVLLSRPGGGVLGRGELSEPDGYPCQVSQPPLRVEVTLTERGSELASRPAGVLTRVEMRGSGFPQTGWIFRLRAGG